jgi:hypothetical protein
MELNKPLSVHMTHAEYDEYKLWQTLRMETYSIQNAYTIFHGARHNGITIHNESETIKVLKEEVNYWKNIDAYQKDEIRVLKNEITLIKESIQPKRRWYKIWN